MATTAKSKKAPVKKQVSSTKPKGVVASKKKGLNRKQWSVIAVVGVVVLAIGGYLGLQAYQNSTSDAASCVSKTFKQGSSGSCVKYIQTLVNYKAKAGQGGSKVTVDGAFGSKTVAAVKAFQKHWSLNVDGTVGKKTWAGLCSAQMGYTDSKGKNHGIWLSQAALNAAKSAGCSVGNDVVR